MKFLVGCVSLSDSMTRNGEMQWGTGERQGKSGGREPNPGHEEALQFVGFHVGDEEFVINILCVQEILRTQQLTRVPNSPECMEGVMNLRGKIIPVIALRKRFGLEEALPDKQNRIVVVEVRGSVFGFAVDAVSEVLRLSANSVEPPPRLGLVEREYVSGVGKLGDRLLILLDTDRLLSNPEQEMTSTAAAGA
jgi:purine-binding chemotaxis protein CheW